MDCSPLLLPDNTVIDPTQPPPSLLYPRVEGAPPDQEKNEPPTQKPTFKSVLQAKKRLQAFKTASLPSSPKKPKLEEREKEEVVGAAKKAAKKAVYHDDVAKAVIEEIEEMKREEQALLDSKILLCQQKQRSKSRSPDKSRFKKVTKKSRNYRRRSSSVERPRRSPKRPRKHPRTWREFGDANYDSHPNKESDAAPSIGHNDVLRQLHFESPAQPIKSVVMKTVKLEDKAVPFSHLRYTRTKPFVSYSVNIAVVKDCFPTRREVEALPVSVFDNFVNFLRADSIRFDVQEDRKKVKVKAWYPRDWSEPVEECKLLEKSVGLSFLQNYAGEEDEVEMLEETKKEKQTKGEEAKEAQKKSEEVNKEGTKKTKESKLEETEDEKTDEPKEHKREKKREETANEPQKKKRKKSKKEKRAKNKEKAKRKKTKEKKKKPDVKEGKKAKKNEESEDGATSEAKVKKSEETTKKRRRESEDKSKKQEGSEVVEEAVKSRKQECEDKPKRCEQSEETWKKGEEFQKSRRRESDDKFKKHGDAEEVTKRRRSESFEKSKKRESSEDKNKSRIKSKVVIEAQESEHSLKKRLEKAQKFEEIRVKLEKEHQTKKEDLRATRKSRWSEPENPPNFSTEEAKFEEIRDKTPNTDEYHSLWESEDEVTSSVSRQVKVNRSWESDEELFERSQNKVKKASDDYADLEIPLNICNFSRRREEDSLSVVDELKLLKEERKSLGEERRKLELEKQQILRLQEEVKEEKREFPRMRSSTPEIKVKKEKMDDYPIDSLNSSMLSTISSADSNLPVAALENEYEEFIKAVSSESSISSKKKERRSSSDSSSDSDHKRKKRKKKKKKKKKRENEGFLLGKNIFNEFDISLPSDLPEVSEVPKPVPSPLPLDKLLPIKPVPSPLPLDKLLPITTPLLLNLNELKKPEDSEVKKPFVFSAITLNKKTNLIDNSNLNLDDSNSADFTDKFLKKNEENETKAPKTLNLPVDILKPIEETKCETKKEEISQPSKQVEESPVAKEVEETQAVKKKSPVTKEKDVSQTQRSHTPTPKDPPIIQNIQDVPLPPEKATPKSKPVDTKPTPKKSTDKSKDKRRSRSRSPKRAIGRSTTSHRRHSSPRRRSPTRRRSSPWRRSPSPRRRSSPRRRRPSTPSPPSRRRKRTPTPPPRRRSSPMASPIGLKKSVADSTISDDMLPQSVGVDERSQSPPTGANIESLGVAKQSPPIRTSRWSSPPSIVKSRRAQFRVSPQPSPKRMPLDDRINQVLGLDKLPPPPPPASVQTNQMMFNYVPSTYPASAYAPIMFTQPPPPLPKPVATPNKLVQMGNILQVVPTEEIPLSLIENQNMVPNVSPGFADGQTKILQVGNMLQIVPGVIPPQLASESEPQTLIKPVTSPLEIKSAETMMKQKLQERKAEKEKRRQERERRRKEKERKWKEKERRKQLKLKLKAENMIKRAIQLETEALANEEGLNDAEQPTSPTIQWPPATSPATPTSRGILSQGGGTKTRKSVQFADGVRPGEGTSPSGGEELSSPPPRRLPKEKRYKKTKIPKKSKKRKVRVKVVKKAPPPEEDEDEDDDDDDDNLPPPSPPPGSPPPHIFPSRVKAHTINNVHQYVGSIIQQGAGLMFRAPPPPPPPPQVVINRHQMAPARYLQQGFAPPDISNLPHQFPGVAPHPHH